jgi:hypothetical protein
MPRGALDAARQWLLFGGAYYTYRLARGLVDGHPNIAFQHGRGIVELERSLHSFFEVDVQRWAIDHTFFIHAANWMYINSHFLVTTAFLIWLYTARNHAYYFVRNMFLVAMLIALVSYIVFPTAPPRFFPEWGFVDSVANLTHVSHDSVAVNSLVNQYAAIPSMHVAFALMIAVPLARLSKHRVTRMMWTLYPVVVVLVIISTANHFVTDGVLGAMTAGFAAWTAAWLARARPAAWAFQSAKATA